MAKRAFTAAIGDHGCMEDAVIIISDGKIVAIGSGLTPPPDLPVIRFPDETIIPGLIDAANSLGGGALRR